MTRLELSDPRWAELTHAYGSAVDIPAQLRSLRACTTLPSRWQDEPLSSLWQSLCHQGVPDTASYAAVPHLLEIALGRPAREGEQVLHLVGNIIAYQHRGPPMPTWLAQPYDRAIALAVEGTRDWCASGPAESRDALLLLVDLSALAGDIELSRVMLALESGEFEFVCAACKTRGMIGLGEDGLEVGPVKWTRQATMGSAGVTSAVSAQARDMGHLALARQLAALTGAIRCPGCARELVVFDAVLQGVA